MKTAAFITALALMLTASPALSDGPTVKVARKDGVGTYLTDSDGRTLYWHKMDPPMGSVCSDSCVVNWPPFYIKDIRVSVELEAADFWLIVREDGKRQVTFRGYPLYYYSGDSAKGDTNGHGTFELWVAARP
jgi:predicted lipoprotein with Yx(FWY)xxD motif